MKTNNFPDEDAYRGVYVFNETDQALPCDSSITSKIAQLVEQHEQCTFKLVEVVFVDEEEIVRINEEHLERDYVTDIISFRYDEDATNSAIEGTLFCCLPRIFEQAEEFEAAPSEELKRIVIHGLLHLAGYEDKNDKQKLEMQKRENFYLQKLG